MNKFIIEKEKINTLPFVVKKEIYLAEEYSRGSLDYKIRKMGGQILRIWGNFKHFHVVVKYKTI